MVIKLDASVTRWINHNDIIKIGELNVTCFSKIHDGIDPYSFLIEFNTIYAGVITDIGIACENVINAFKKCHACILESNYDEEMLDGGPYPYHLKKRIRGGEGHISNAQALELFLNHKNENLGHLLLGHLSQTNNKPQIVEDLFSKNAGDTKIVVASRYKESEVYEVNGIFNNQKAAVSSGSGDKQVEKEVSEITTVAIGGSSESTEKVNAQMSLF